MGTDSFTYRICDAQGDCSNYANVTLNIANNAPSPGDDSFAVRGFAQLGDLLANDTEPDGDNFVFVSIQTQPQHGSLQNPNLQYPAYSPDPGFTGTASFTYRVCDSLGSCSNATVTLYVVADGENDGAASCKAVGQPINVTNGNMYIQQTDYALPSTGPAIKVTRTFNSNSQRTGLFGQGWSTEYDQTLIVHDNNLVRLNEGDGRATYFGRPVGAAGAFAPLAGDVHGQLAQTGGGMTLTLLNGSVYQFSAAGKLLSIADRNGNQTTLSYNTNGHLTSITNPFGRVLTVTPNTNGQVTAISDGMGAIATYGYTGSRLDSVVYTDNSRFDFHYDWENNRQVLKSVTDALSHVVESHEYDTEGRAITSRRHGGVEEYTLAYVSNGETRVTDARGNVTKYFFDKSQGRSLLTSVEGLCGCGNSQSRMTYDSRLNVLTKTNALNQTTTYTYDAQGNRLTSTDVLGTTTYTYNSFGEVLTATDPMDGVTTVTYDSHGNPLTITDALNQATTLTYNTRGQVLTVTDARAKATTLLYDTSGNLQRVTDAAGNQTNYAYDGRGRVTSVTDALTRVTAYEYDLAGRLKKVTRPDASVITATYDLAGRRTQLTDPLNHATTYAYDGANRLTSVTDALSHTTAYAYDLMSNMTSRTDALGRVTDYQYDDFNRLKKIIYPAATVGTTRLTELVGYDAGGNVMSRTDTAGRVTAYEYDTSQRLKKVTDALSQVTQYQYNARSQMTEVIDAIGQHYVFTPDALGRVTGVTRGGHSMSLAYDAVGNRTGRTDYNGQTTAYTYDNLNRLTTITYPDTSTATYGYDALSRLTRATNAAGTVSFAYDVMGRVSSTTDVFGRTLASGYDANGNRTSLSMGARSLSYSYDALSRVTQLTEGGQSVSYSYNAVGQPLTRSLPNGVVTTYGYDHLHRVSGLLERRGTLSLGDRSYGYNAAGEIEQASENETGWPEGIDTAHSYSYDESGRLTAVGQSNPYQQAESYSYDGVGNRTTSHQSSSYQYQPFNQLTSMASGFTYSYDGNGNQTTKQDSSGQWDAGWQYSWDAENRLTAVSLPTGGSIEYRYDALGRRVERTSSVSGLTTQYSYDGQDVILDTHSDGSTVEYWNGPGVDQKLRMKHSVWGTYYFGQDQLGSTVLLTDESGQAAERVEYDSFGNSTGSSLTRYTYTGREWDEEAGLYYYRARWYDSQQGRFISEDPIGLAGGINMYAYVNNNPVNRTDPSGLREDLRPVPRDQLPPEYIGRQESIAAFEKNFVWWDYFFIDLFVKSFPSGRPCKSWAGRFGDNFKETNDAIPGLAAPPFAPAYMPLPGSNSVGDAFARGAGVPTPFEWARSGFRATRMGAAPHTRFETGVIVGFSAIATNALVSVSLEGGIAIGSAVSATFPRPCECSE